MHNFQLTYAAFLFPAIPLMMISFGNRYTSLSKLIRKIHDEFINKKISPNDKSASRYFAQIQILNKRLRYVKLMQFFSGISFFLNLMTILVGIYFLDISLIIFITALFFFALAICVFLIEINISTKALRTHLEDLEDLEENY
ncbi:MAG: hypothetical protein CMM92_02735 [Rickettsiales bacterium]|nr:hypothetical protein [Rickettsiales bacterium]RPG14878.1 MAG: DUF2721 domain-containing protein [Pelagibacteraceae bacterium TMED195]|tara:strand:- start:397 stop:822 length:426 start_codon:yes stop_codon:yes gene_type:complete